MDGMYGKSIINYICRTLSAGNRKIHFQITLWNFTPYQTCSVALQS